MVIYGNKELGASLPQETLCGPKDWYKQMKEWCKEFAAELLLLFAFAIEKSWN
jgi:hypothetical protein